LPLLKFQPSYYSGKCITNNTRDLLNLHSAIMTSNELTMKAIGKRSCVWITNRWQMLDLPEFDFAAGDTLETGNK